MIDDWCVNSLAKIEVYAVFHWRAIQKSISPKRIQLCMETPCCALQFQGWRVSWNCRSDSCPLETYTALYGDPMLVPFQGWTIKAIEWGGGEMSRNYRSDSCPRGFASRSNICFKNIKFPRGNYQPIVPRSLRETAARKQNILFNHEGMNVLQFKRTKEKLVVSENQRFNHALPLARSELESGLPCCGRLLLLNVNSI